MKYEEKSRIQEDVKFIKVYSYSQPAYGYGMETVNIYMFQDKEGQKLVWKTTSVLCIDRENKIGGSTFSDPIFPNPGSLIKIKGTVKGFNTYKGVSEVVLTRVKLLDIIEQAKTKEEIQEEKKQAQLANLNEADQIREMPYSQYKEHYSDCETVIGSYKDGRDGYPYAIVQVIIPEGRMKNSGVRGKSFSYYYLKNEVNECIAYKAVCKENALKRAAVEYPEHTWEYIEWV